MALNNFATMSQPFPLTEENLQALLRSIEDSSISISRSTSRTRRDNASDIYSLDISDATDVLPGVRRAPVPPSTIDSTPQGSVVNFSARQAAARLSTTGRRPVQGTRHRRRLENARMLYNPHAVPPQPEDYLPTPTYAVRRIDKNLADYLSTLRSKIPEDVMSLFLDDDKRRNGDRGPHIPKTLKERVKKGHLTQPYLKGLEENIREFVLSATAGDRVAVVTNAERTRKGRNQLTQQFLLEKEITIEPDTDGAEAFSRWIVYQIAEYYRISCYTKIVDNKRIPCVILNVDENKSFNEVPRPIWTYV
ncbi:hypothetical protein V1520DRAFT_340114 [Lipomyces starkeyi]|uniref:R3H-associated N-terminal domain-containing protein n=1 Tax=Lipomyces starkeyi NRRL Y-11557 TaxID=675824 RepID=A0A1E3Q0Q2_LIPST|nr:hypothetical protein LIPSTDRAFT_74207 [Lipomyces starkeyi NRRL Y-11557]